MDKKTLFKEFASKHPELLTFIKNKQNTWQDFYEIYDIYGEDASVFKEEKKDTVKDNKTTNLLKAFEDIDVNKINENLDGVRKILAVLGEFTRKDDTKVKRSYNKPTSNYDD